MALLSREELRVLMLPWVGVLRDYVDLGEWHATWDANGDRVVWMQMVSDAPRGIEPRAFDAMELLTLLGEIDFAAWRVALAASWPRHANAWIEAANGRALRFGWKLVFRSASANDAAAMDIAKWCDRIALDGVARTRSREYLRARNVLEDQYKQLEAMAAERAIRKPVARQRLFIPVQLVMKDGPLETRLLKLVQIAALQYARESSCVAVFQEDPWKPLMRITDVNIKDYAEQSSNRAFLSATQLAAFDIRLNQLSLDRVDVTIDTAMLYTTGLQYLLTANGVGPDKQVRVGAARWVVVPAAMQRQTIAAIYSALLASSSVRTVAVNMTPLVQDTEDVDVTKISTEDRDHMWQWTAVSLFSDQSRNHVEHVDIDVGDLCQNDVTAMQRALEHMHPLHALSLSASQASSRAVAIDEYVYASKFRLLPPDSEAPRGVKPEIHLERQQVQMLLRLSDGWAAVQLPGWGTAWVHKDDCEDCTGRPVLSSAHRGISSLKLTNITGSSTTPVISLLRLVGRQIRTLEITRIRLFEPLDDWLREVLQACPSLEDLTVSTGGHMMTLDTLIDSYERGYCRLRSFALRETSVQDAADVPRFITTLADPTHAMTKHLRELTLSYRSNTPLPGVSEALHSMLKVNTTMESLKMLVGFHSPVVADQLIRPKAFSKYMIPIAVRLLPLSLSKKAAFLSVTTGRRDQGRQEASSALQQFDSRVVSLIFQFAAQCRNRNVAVHFWNARN